VKIVNEHLSFPKAPLLPPAQSGYILLAAEVDRRRRLFLWESRRKRRLLAECKELARKIAAVETVIGAHVFKAVLIPPGRGEFLRQRPEVHVARFDVVVLIEVRSREAAEGLQSHPLYGELEAAIKGAASHTHIVVARNIRRIDNVDHSRDGVFLFNYFYSDDAEANVTVWEYTAGWFVAETGLDNSTVLAPLEGQSREYAVINHCRWDGLADILPSLIFKPSFRKYVLANFEANRVAAMPILYRLA
jgi:hypothetical protein